METSLLIAKFIGPVMLISGLSLLINSDGMRAVFEDFVNSPALIFVAGIIALAVGLAIIIFHNHWAAGWPLLITIYGWLALLGGIARIGFPQPMRKLGQKMMDRPGFLVMAGICNVLLGGFLTYRGFWA